MASASSVAGAPASPLLLIGVISIPVALLLRWFASYTRTVLKVRSSGLPAIHSGLEIFESAVRSWFPRVPVLVPMDKFTLKKPFKKFADARSDMIVLTEASAPNRVAYLFGSPKSFREIGRNGDIFLKPVEKVRYRLLNTFGLQLVSTQNGAEHERHKRVVKAVFNAEFMENGWKNMRNMWRTMLREEGVYPAAANSDTAPIVRDMRSTMLKVTLGAIGASWFDIDIPWDPVDSSTSSDAGGSSCCGHMQQKKKSELMPFAETLQVVMDSPFAQITLPLWFMEWSPSSYLRRAGWAQRSLITHIKAAQSEARRRNEAFKEEIGGQDRARKYRNLIGALVDAQNDVEMAEQAEKGYVAPEVGLTDKEVQGNIFTFLIGGHETSSYTMTFAMSLLARNPEWQEKLHAEVSKANILPLDGAPSVDNPKPLKFLAYEEMSNFPLVLAAAVETLRMRDMAMQLTRVASCDTTLNYTTWEGDATANAAGAKVQKHTVAIPAGTRVHLDMAAFGVNPFKWEDPETYNPARHLRETEDVNGKRMTVNRNFEIRSNAATQVTFQDFLGFSAGSRQCIGKRFAEVTMVCFLAHMVLNFRWEVVPNPGETQEEANVRASTGSEQFVLTPPNYDLRMTRR
ncbi:cytochrome P450 [Microdochium trichocladiopsis]|uniref:Cytochrome P450 n=1 Tax=Microdochium trichocladiopsis TaxID=1682393 RepID=A0A9P9BP10_9PEZI|nr:cytochrome P450 [Microdochium trichocladiopsis]KAH7028044.1 cytochrome P450 [Microdochium trichocladiopsis]